MRNLLLYQKYKQCINCGILFDKSYNELASDCWSTGACINCIYSRLARRQRQKQNTLKRLLPHRDLFWSFRFFL